jgi:16S rRNA pseudouridine516 synthase
MRLDRYLAESGHGTRSEVKELIRKGTVQVNGQVVRDSSLQVAEDGSASVLVHNRPVCHQHHVHLMMHKPEGIITALEDQHLPTIASLIPAQYRHAGLFPVGRLDRDATGLLILTNDGTLGHRLASPRWQVWKTYLVDLDGIPFDEQDPGRFLTGIVLADGQVCRPARLTVTGSQSALLSIHEGKFHQVKKMMLATGRRVTRLHRCEIGPLRLDPHLLPGQCRELTPAEIHSLYELVELKNEP